LAKQKKVRPPVNGGKQRFSFLRRLKNPGEGAEWRRLFRRRRFPRLTRGRTFSCLAKKK
jgi:hypothetical protein